MGQTDMRMEPQTLILRRRFHTTPSALYAAWTAVESFATWWGPENVDNVECALDVRVGGSWRVIMRMAGHADFPLRGEYLEIVPNARLVFTMDPSEHPDEWHVMLDGFRDTPSGARGGDVTVTVSFDEHPEGTELTLSQRYALNSDRDAYYRMGAPTGWGQSFDKLERLLAIHSTSDDSPRR